MTAKEIIDGVKIAEKQLLLADKESFGSSYNDFLRSLRPVNPEPHLTDLWNTMISELATLKNTYIDNNMDKHDKLQLFMWIGHMKMFIDASHSS